MTWSFFATALIVVLMPGPGVVYTLAVTLGQGLRAGLVAAAGCTLGILPHMAASILGLAAVLHASATAFQVVKLAGVAFLLWMAAQVWRGAGTLSVEGRDAHATAWRLVRDGIALNLLNPKLSIFFLAFLPQSVTAGGRDAAWHMTGLAIAFMALTFAAFALYALFAAFLRDRVLSRPAAMAWLRGGFATAFAALALRLAFMER
ncbi:LysE family translocator [Mesobaculum littorinae]|uniref:LysE family translocator n=1 Tax=Mesobaculum littorinae TaxID=2486419 RepID=A0A438AJX6_9RHOB|nr:LysE family translocator [Mesobaculum littorinae]RVV98954.1 LysE family translocator [Mesobaculum littorinae]